MACTFTIRDLQGTEREVTEAEISSAVNRIRTFFTAVKGCFVERDRHVDIIMYAILMREHVLLHGPPGTAKSALADTVVKGIQGAESWRCDLSRFMGETQVFGDFDVKEANMSGKLLHLTQGSILEAHFANLGELLDCNTALLRSLLRVLNEREFLRGPQRLMVPLMTAVGNTNVDPLEAMKKDPLLEAVLDRFLFWEPVTYVRDPGARILMLERYMQNAAPTLPSLSLDDIVVVSATVLHHSFLVNPFILRAYEQLVRTFGEARGYAVTDRRFNKGVQILDAAALLRGSFEVDWSDLAQAELIFAQSEDERAQFVTALQKACEHWQEEAVKNSTNAELLAVEAFEHRIPSIDLQVASADELVAAKRTLSTILRDLRGFTPTDPAAQQKRSELMNTVDEQIAAVQRKIDEV